MSTPSKDIPVSAMDDVLALPERTTALRSLSAALAQLGEDAERAARSSDDVRLRVVACQAGHLAGDVWALVSAAHTNDPVPEADSRTASVAMVRHYLQVCEGNLLPVDLERSLGWLLQLADAAMS